MAHQPHFLAITFLSVTYTENCLFMRSQRFSLLLFKRSNVGETLKYQSPYLSWSEIRLTASAARCIFMNKQISAPTLDIANYTKWDTFSGCLFSPRTHTHTRRCSAHAERAHKVEKRERKQTGRRGKIVVYYTQY
jgi:hypothetical protein